VLATVDRIDPYDTVALAVKGTLSLISNDTSKIVPSDEDGQMNLTEAAVCAYYKRLLKKGAHKKCYAVNYRIEKSYGGFAAGLACSTSDSDESGDEA
jgi:hypothetical protein